MKRAYIDISEGQVHYRTEGSGDSLLLLHQTPTSSREYLKMIPILARKFRVIAMDTLGYGESDHPPHKYQIEDYARSVVSFLDAMGIGKTSIVGHHTGALIAVEVAVTHPERLHKLVLSGCPVYTAEELATRFSNESEAYRPMELKADGSHLLKPWGRLKEMVPGAPIEDLHEITVDTIKAGVRGEEGHWAAHQYKSQSRLPLIKCPTLVLSGTKDLFYGKLEETKKLIPQSKTATIEGGNAFLLRLKSREFAEAILAFI